MARFRAEDIEDVFRRMKRYIEIKSEQKKLPKHGRQLKTILSDMINLVFGEDSIIPGSVEIFPNSVTLKIQYELVSPFIGVLQARSGSSLVNERQTEIILIYYTDEEFHYITIY